jgi:hypothetical protein
VPGPVRFERQGFEDLNRQAIETGDLTGAIAGVPGMSLPHECHMFTWSELEALFAGRPCDVIESSASNYLSVNLGELVNDLDESLWQRFLDWEERACQSSGRIEAGTRIIVALRRTR